MAEVKKNIMTVGGLKKFEKELEDLKINRRKENSQKIKEAREQGDLSENADYDAAKDEQTEIENRIAELEAILKNVEVVDDKDIEEGIIGVGSKVKLLDVEFNETEEYQIKGSTEANILKGIISNESPLGLALIGKKAGQTASFVAPSGDTVEYKILEVE